MSKPWLKGGGGTEYEKQDCLQILDIKCNMNEHITYKGKEKFA